MTAWKIRILQGSHEGTEIPLVPGHITIGCDELQDDIVLTDEGMRAQHLELEVTDANVIARSSAFAELYVGKSLVSLPGEVELTPRQHIYLEPLQLVLGPQSADLSLFNEAPQPKINTQNKRPSKFVRSLLLSLVFACAPTALLTWLYLHEPAQEPHSRVSADQALQQVRTKTHKLGLKDVRVEWNDQAQQVVLAGYVPTKESKVQLLGQIERSNISYKSDLRIMSDIKEGVRFILDSMGFHQIQVTDGDSAGTVALSGPVTDPSRWSQVERILETDIPGLVAWKVRLSKAGAHMNTLRELLSEAKLLDQVNVVEIGDRIEIRGELNDHQTESFYEASRRFRELWGERPAVILKSIPKITPERALHLPVRSISLGQTPYVVLTDNIKYSEGARLPSGHRVDRITENRIDLSKNETRISIELRKEPYERTRISDRS